MNLFLVKYVDLSMNCRSLYPTLLFLNETLPRLLYEIFLCTIYDILLAFTQENYRSSYFALKLSFRSLGIM